LEAPGGTGREKSPGADENGRPDRSDERTLEGKRPTGKPRQEERRRHSPGDERPGQPEEDIPDAADEPQGGQDTDDRGRREEITKGGNDFHRHQDQPVDEPEPDAAHCRRRLQVCGQERPDVPR